MGGRARTGRAAWSARRQSDRWGAPGGPGRTGRGLPGYDAEGQLINDHFPDLTPTDRRWYRGPWPQECLEAQLRGIALHLGVEAPLPLFLVS